MRKKIFSIFAIVFLLVPQPARCDLFGGDVVVLSQILVQAIQQLAQLRSILGTTQDSLNLMRDINRGIHDAMEIVRTIDPNIDPGLYRDWQKVEDAVRRVEDIYGQIPQSSEARIEKDTDQGVAEAIAFNNELYTYTRQIDDIGEQIKRFSHSASPAGASKLTAESLGVMLHVLDQMLRAQGKGVKLQALSLAMQNHKDKGYVAHQVKSRDDITRAMKTEKNEFKMPQF